MNKPKHTPGPLHVYQSGNDLEIRRENNDFIAVVPDFTSTKDGHNYAFLFAAAPELLEAAKESEYQVRVIGTDYAELLQQNPGLAERLYLAMLGIRQAIAKAQGSEK